MALSRVYLRAHWLSDTVAGALLGAGLALGWPALLMAIRHRRDPTAPTVLTRPAAYRLLWFSERRSQRARAGRRTRPPRAGTAAHEEIGMAQPATDPPHRDRAVLRTKPADTTSTQADKPCRTTGSDPGAGSRRAAEAVMGLDMVLVDAARGPLRRLVPPAGHGAPLRLRPGPPAGDGRGPGRRARQGAGPDRGGHSELAPSKKDKRFADPAWSRQPVCCGGRCSAPGHRPHRLGADRGRRPRLAGRRADPVHRDEPRRRAGAEQRPGGSTRCR